MSVTGYDSVTYTGQCTTDEHIIGRIRLNAYFPVSRLDGDGFKIGQDFVIQQKVDFSFR